MDLGVDPIPGLNFIFEAEKNGTECLVLLADDEKDSLAGLVSAEISAAIVVSPTDQGGLLFRLQ